MIDRWMGAGHIQAWASVSLVMNSCLFRWVVAVFNFLRLLCKQHRIALYCMECGGVSPCFWSAFLFFCLLACLFGFFFSFGFLKQGFFVALAILELAELIDPPASGIQGLRHHQQALSCYLIAGNRVGLFLFCFGSSSFGLLL